MTEPLRTAAPLDDDTGFHLAVASARVAHLTNTALKPHDLRVRHYVVLALTSEHDNLTQVDLAREVALAASQVVGLVDELEGRGLVQRQVSSDDRRRRLVTATADGKALVARARRDVAAARDEAFGALDATQRAALLASLKAVNGRTGSGAQPGEIG
jgi:DNA-binding MarR family transcriptional regulator